jgi:5-methylcytosine-specific restriction endonuclease McrA
MSKRDWFAKRKEQGLCGNCPNSTVDKKTLCTECALKAKEKRTQKRNDRISKGLCPVCGEKSQSGITCFSCCEKDKRKKVNRRKNGLCSRCGENANGSSYCAICAKLNGVREKNRRLNNLAQGKCKCGRPLLEGKKWCANCKSRYDERIKNNKIKQICVNCKCELFSKNLCEKCYFKTYSNRHFKTYKLWEELREIWIKQNKKCPYTGYDLNAGCMTLDHIVPLSKDGKNVLENLQWLYAPLNTMKLDLTEDEFFDLIKRIYEYKFIR